jgi:pimeloyl-ACP methyl ester carboxylesterase
VGHSYRDDPETGDFPGERSCGSTGLRYVLEGLEGDCGSLVIPFSAAHDPGEPARYYTHRVLRDLPCPRLFVLDDQGPGDPARPCWYLGRLPELEVARAVVELVERVAAELGAGRLITCGSSMGGWAALYFGCRLGASDAIAGEPQVRLGAFLAQETHSEIQCHIAGDIPVAEVPAMLDDLVFAAYRAAPAPPRTHLFSGRTPYLEHDVLPLARFLDGIGAPCELELSDHREHVPDLGVRFPPFLRSRLERLLAGDPFDTEEGRPRATAERRP